MKLHPYLNLDGNTEAAFTFYAKLLGGKIRAMMRFGDSPMAGNTPPDAGNLIMHACLEFGDQLLMSTDCTSADPFKKLQGMHVVIDVLDNAEAERIFAGLAEGGEVGMPIQETFWAHRFGMVRDRFGVPWMVNHPKEG